MTTPNASEDVDQQAFLFIASGKMKRYSHCGRMVVSYKTKHALTIGSGNHVAWYLPDGAEKLCPHKTCTNMFKAPLFIIAQTCKPPKPRCP